jgi:prophage antirepressor-like protein
MQGLEIFKKEDFEVRVIEIDSEPWFVAMDVAKALDYTDTQAMTRRLDDDEIGSYTDTSSGQSRKIVVINESGLFNAILGSNKPNAKVFKKWITKEVLPSIRKTGGYAIDPKTYPAALRALADKVEEMERVKEEKKELQIVLDSEMDWASVKRMEAYHRTEFSWRPLRKYSIVNGFEIKKVFDQNYGTVNSYHKDVWKAVFDIEVSPNTQIVTIKQ